MVDFSGLGVAFRMAAEGVLSQITCAHVLPVGIISTRCSIGSSLVVRGTAFTVRHNTARATVTIENTAAALAYLRRCMGHGVYAFVRGCETERIAGVESMGPLRLATTLRRRDPVEGCQGLVCSGLALALRVAWSVRRARFAMGSESAHSADCQARQSRPRALQLHCPRE